MIRKALIPIAGKATRLMPVTSAVPKAMLPLVDSADQIRSVLHLIRASLIRVYPMKATRSVVDANVSNAGNGLRLMKTLN